LSALLSDTLESFTAQARQQQITLEGSAAPNIDPVQMDVQRMGRVLNNLVSNALRYTPPGGGVILHAEPIAGGVAVSIHDTGQGILPEDLPHVFERFYRGDKSRTCLSGGAGLGLAIAKGIVEAHGGSIGVASQRGQGTVFTFILPKSG
jgi:signal transduction histidine kinase